MIAARVTVGQTGAVWQRRMLPLEPWLGRQRVLAAMLQRYLECQVALAA